MPCEILMWALSRWKGKYRIVVTPQCLQDLVKLPGMVNEPGVAVGAN
jgi:hypothetical protein